MSLETVKEGDRYTRTFLYMNDAGKMCELHDKVTIKRIGEQLCILTDNDHIIFHDVTANEGITGSKGRPSRYVRWVDLTEENFPVKIYPDTCFIQFIIYHKIP